MLFGGPGISYAKNKPEAWTAARQRLLQYIGTAEKLLALAPDVWLGAHPQFSQTFEKQHRLAAGESPNPFIDPRGWKDYMRGRLEYAVKLLAEVNAAEIPENSRNE